MADPIPSRTRWWLYLLGAVVLVAATVAVAIGRDPGESEHDGKGDPDRDVAAKRIEASPEGSVRQQQAAAAVTATGFDSERLWGTGNDWEPAIAADPGSSYVYQATTRYGGPKACSSCSDPAIIVRASSDGGATFGADTYICACKNVKAQNDPQLAVASDGTIYAAWLNDYQPGVVFSKSTNHGATWSTPKSVEGKGLSFSDKPILAISPTGKDVYIAFNSSDSYVVASHDFGATWGSRVKTNSDSLYWFAEGGVVAPNGNVYFSESAENQSATGQVKLAVLRSTNGGTSWTQLMQLSDAQQTWNSESTSLSAYAGQTVRIQFMGTTDSSLPSSFFVDDVSTGCPAPSPCSGSSPTAT